MGLALACSWIPHSEAACEPCPSTFWDLTGDLTIGRCERALPEYVPGPGFGTASSRIRGGTSSRRRSEALASTAASGQLLQKLKAVAWPGACMEISGIAYTGEGEMVLKS
eukprot:g28343.t1